MASHTVIIAARDVVVTPWERVFEAISLPVFAILFGRFVLLCAWYVSAMKSAAGQRPLERLSMPRRDIHILALLSFPL